MRCPQCNAPTEVKDTRIKKDHVIRKRLCFNEHFFQTKEEALQEKGIGLAKPIRKSGP